MAPPAVASFDDRGQIGLKRKREQLQGERVCPAESRCRLTSIDQDKWMEFWSARHPKPPPSAAGAGMFYGALLFGDEFYGSIC